MKEEEIQKNDCGRQPKKCFFFFFFFEILLDLNHAVPSHVADESQTCQPDTPPEHHHQSPRKNVDQ